ncbi:MAG TPA: ankyrin repeat domain-containing protein, partial [Patescibacteria group bacterium]|nr:ankyrin repeat domain-containing protein [Patescibacteria group bacterium]
MSLKCRVLWIVLSILTIMTPACSKNQSESKKESGKADGKYQPQLFAAVAAGDKEKVVRFLNETKKLDQRNESGYTPLHWAVLTNQEEIVSLFLSRGAEIQPTSTSGYTPLHDAVYGGNIKIVKLLIDHGADIYAADQLGKRPLDLAIERGHAQIVPLLKPLHLAAESGDLIRVKNIVEKIPKSLNLKDERGWSPLHLAVKNGHLEIAKFLMDRGAEINARGVRGVTPLRMALDCGQKPTADYLREKDAQDLSDALLLGKKLREKQAVIWHLFHTGWVIKTKSSLLIFDYDYDQVDSFALPPAILPCLSSGEIDPKQIRDQKVFVFLPFFRDPDRIDTILSWKKAIKDITYISGEDKIKDSAFVYIGPRQQKKLEDLEISTIRSNGFGVGFAVKVDGLTIFYGGDHMSSDQSWNSFSSEIDFLHEKIKKFDLVFLQMMFQEQIQSDKGVFYAL